MNARAEGVTEQELTAVKARISEQIKSASEAALAALYLDPRERPATEFAG